MGWRGYAKRQELLDIHHDIALLVDAHVRPGPCGRPACRATPPAWTWPCGPRCDLAWAAGRRRAHARSPAWHPSARGRK
eukprot:3683177-Pyramimonas_sp.AAC.1